MSETSQQHLAETPDRDGAYPRLTDEQLAHLSAQGERRPTERGHVLFREGDEDYDFFVVLIYAEREVLFGPAWDEPVRAATSIAMVVLGWQVARDVGRSLRPLLFRWLEPAAFSPSNRWTASTP